MKPFTFDQIPKMMGKLFEKMERIELLLSNIPVGQGHKDELLTISEASKFLNLAVPTIYSKVSRNEIPVNKQGKRLYFYKSELLQWISSGRMRTDQEVKKSVDATTIEERSYSL